mgnify:CR=1 FL=1
MNENQKLLMGLFENPNDKNQLNCMIDKDVDEVQLSAMMAAILDFVFKNDMDMDDVIDGAGLVLENTIVSGCVDKSQMN